MREPVALLGTEHLVALVLCVAGGVGLVMHGRRHRADGARTVRLVLAVALLVAAVPSQVVVMWPSRFDPDSSLPLELCDLAWMTAVWALLTRQALPTALTYFWGLTLTLQGVLTPALDHPFPAWQSWVFWAKHLLVVWSALLLTVGLGRGPRWREHRLAVALTLVWAVVGYVVDRAVGANYGYLVRKPASASLLDALGPWPVYLVAGAVVLTVVWALMTWPWVRVARRAG